MAEFLLDFINLNETVNYGFVLPLFFVYLAVLWLIVSAWVFHDAKKRYTKKGLPVLFGVCTFLLSFPFFLLYLLIRPEPREEFLPWDEEVAGGVNVPIVNFTGKDGVVLSLELKINPKRMAGEKDTEMKIDVTFDSPDQEKQVVQINPNEVLKSIENIEVTDRKHNKKITNIFAVIKTKLASIKPKKQENRKETDKKDENKGKDAEMKKDKNVAEVDVVTVPEVKEEEVSDKHDDSQRRKNKKKKKRRR